jgi:hypothetical protein
MISNTNLIVCTSISVAIESLIFCFISFQRLTPMTGALFLVNITTSSMHEYWSYGTSQLF